MLFAFQGMGENRTGFWLAVIRQLVLYIPLLLLMDRLFGMYGLVWAQVLSDGIMALVRFYFWHRFEKRAPGVPAYSGHLKSAAICGWIPIPTIPSCSICSQSWAFKERELCMCRKMTIQGMPTNWFRQSDYFSYLKRSVKSTRCFIAILLNSTCCFIVISLKSTCCFIAFGNIKRYNSGKFSFNIHCFSNRKDGYKK